MEILLENGTNFSVVFVAVFLTSPDGVISEEVDGAVVMVKTRSKRVAGD